MDWDNYRLTILHNLRSFNKFDCSLVIKKFLVELVFIVVDLPVFKCVLLIHSWPLTIISMCWIVQYRVLSHCCSIVFAIVIWFHYFQIVVHLEHFHDDHQVQSIHWQHHYFPQHLWVFYLRRNFHQGIIF